MALSFLHTHTNTSPKLDALVRTQLVKYTTEKQKYGTAIFVHRMRTEAVRHMPNFQPAKKRHQQFIRQDNLIKRLNSSAVENISLQDHLSTNSSLTTVLKPLRCHSRNAEGFNNHHTYCQQSSKLFIRKFSYQSNNKWWNVVDTDKIYRPKTVNNCTTRILTQRKTNT